MKQFKQDIIDDLVRHIDLIEQGCHPSVFIDGLHCETDRAVSLRAVAIEHGYNHIKRQDTEDIIRAVQKRKPTIHMYIMQDYEGQTVSAFSRAIFTDMDLELDEEDLMLLEELK